MSRVKLRLTGAQFEQLRSHLFPGDGLEAVAVGLCGRRSGKVEHGLSVRQLIPIPHDRCSRSSGSVKWSPAQILPFVEEAMKRNMAVVKVHSHPSGFTSFSGVDDAADKDLFSSVFGWTDTSDPHASAVMLPNGGMFGRSIVTPTDFVPLSSIAVAGDDLLFWYPDAAAEELPRFTERHAQLFGVGTVQKMRRLSAAVVGCSGTGSVVVELLARLGVGRLVLVDPDRVEEKNLNRIINATKEDANVRRFKVDVLARAVRGMGFVTELELIPENLATTCAVKAVAGCDVAFGCMDGAEGRHLLNRLASFYALPYFDVGVRLDADGKGGVEQVCGAVHYLQPDRSSLLSRHVIAIEDVRAEGLKRTNPTAYAEQLKLGYIRGVREDRPAVISVNAQLASMAVDEFLARLHPYRLDANESFAEVRISLSQGELYRTGEGGTCLALARHVGRGDVRPLLDMPALTEEGAGE